MDILPVVSGKFPRQLSKSISKTKDDASLRTGLLPPPKGSGFPPKLCWRYFYEYLIKKTTQQAYRVCCVVNFMGSYKVGK